MNGEPRRHHYIFAHKLLPSFFFQKPDVFITALMNRRAELVRSLWDDVGKDIEGSDGSEARIPSDDLDLHLEVLPENTIVAIVELPEAQEMPEAHYVALVYRLGTGDVVGGRDPGSIARVFTLEYGLTLSGPEERTVLCEWGSDGAHMNLGDGPEVSISAFVRRLARLL